MTAPDARHELFEELAVGHALSALEPEDEQLFLAHLLTCRPCQRAVADHRDTLGHLAYAAESAEPPASLLAGIRTGIEASGRAGAFPAPVQLDVVRRRRLSAHTVRFGTAVVGAAAALVLVASLAVTNHNLQQQDARIQRDNVALTQTVGSMLSPGARSVSLTGEGGAKAVAVVKGKTVSLALTGLQVNSSDSIYVLWEKSRFGEVRAVKAFDVKAEGVTVVNNLPLSAADGQLAKLVITHEQGRKAPALSTQPAVVAGDAA